MSPVLLINLINLSLQDGLSKEEIRQHLEEECHHTFDLSRPPFVRATIAKSGPNSRVILLLFHHILMDGWSLGKIWEEVLAFYAAIVSNNDSGLPKLEVQYGDFAAWEQTQLEVGTEAHTKLLKYWKIQLQYATPILQLPHDFARDNSVEKAPVIIGIHLGQKTLSALKTVATSLKISLYAVCLAAYRLMLCEFCATDDVIIASSYSLRPPGTEHLVCIHLLLSSYVHY